MPFELPLPGVDERLARQLAFVRTLDALKQVYRQTILLDGSRRENSAEHSWHLAMMVPLLLEYAATPGLDRERVLRLVLLHDVVEIDAGDVLCYDEAARALQPAREARAAERIFGLLPPEQAAELHALREEFEAQATPAAQFAAALDRFQPLLHNYCTQGHAWRRHGIKRSQVLARNAHIGRGAPRLWELAQRMIDDAVARGWLADG